jgi:hypothetical protein
MKFLNSEKFLHCAFEINPVVSGSDRDVNQSKHAASNNTNGELGCFTDELELLEKEVRRELMASYENLSDGFHPHHSDVYKNDKGGRRGRGGGRGRFNRAARRGAADRHAESQFYHQSGFRDFQNRGKLHARGRSLTDLRDPALYEVEDQETFTMGKLSNTAHPNRTKVKSSRSSSVVRDEKIDKLANCSGLRKSSLPNNRLSAVRNPQDNLHENVPTAISLPSSPSVKNASSEHVSTQERTEGSSMTNASPVKLPSSERVSGANLMGKSTGSRDSLTTVRTISQTPGQAQAIYPKIDSVILDDYKYTDSSPFDNLHDIVQRSEPKGKPATYVSAVIDILNQRSAKVSPDVPRVNDHSLNKTASKGMWKCSLCGYWVPLDNYYQLVDIQPLGTNWKCKLCDKWRP